MGLARDLMEMRWWKQIWGTGGEQTLSCGEKGMGQEGISCKGVWLEAWLRCLVGNNEIIFRGRHLQHSIKQPRR